MNSILFAGIKPPNWLAKIRGLVFYMSFLFVGPIFTILSPTEIFLSEFYSRFGIFVVVVALWELLLAYISTFLFNPSLQLSLRAKWIRALPSFLICLVTFVLLSNLESNVSEVFFFGLIALLGLRAMSQGLSLSSQIDAAFYAFLLYLFLLGNFSSALAVTGWYWQFALLNLALVFGPVAHFLIGLLYAGRTDLATATTPLKSGEIVLTKQSAFLRWHNLLLLAGPATLAAMVYGEFLPKSYLICLFALAPLAHLEVAIDKLKAKNLDLKPTILGYSSLSSIVFLLSLLIIKSFI